MQIVKVIDIDDFDLIDAAKDIENKINSLIADMQGMRLTDIRQLGDRSTDRLYILLTFEK